MKSRYNKTTGLLIGLLAILVISLCGNALAAIAPSVATLEAITNGLNTPLKMAIDGDGSIYVADPRSGGVVVLDKFGTVLKTLPLSVTINSVGLLNGNNNISVPADKAAGKILAALGNYVAVLDENGGEVAKLGGGTAFTKTAGMAVAPDGKIYVVDSGAKKVKVFTSDGSFSLDIAGYLLPNTTVPVKFQLPSAVAVISETSGTKIAVVDTLAGKIILLSPDGAYQGTIGSSGTGYLKFSYPIGTTFEYTNGALSRMYVVDMFQGEVQAIDPALALYKGSTPPAVTGVPAGFLSYVATYGSKNGNLMTPSDVQFDPLNKRLLVANGNSTIVSLGIDGGQNPVVNPPALVIDQPVISVNVPSVVLTGTVDTGCTLAASVNTIAHVSAASFPSPFSWMIPVDGLVPGINVVSITAKDIHGSTITKTATIQYSPPNAAFSIDSYPVLTAQPLVKLSGTAQDGSYVYVGNSVTRESGEADVSGSVWQYTQVLSEGVNYLTVTAARAGFSPSSKIISITLDTQAPVLTVAAIPDGSYTTTQVQNVSGTVVEPNLTGVAVNGIPVSAINGVFSYAVELVKGENTITVTAGDSLGHISSNTRTVVFDPDFPRITVSNPADGSFTNVQDIVISGSVDEVASVKVNGVVANPNGGLDWTAPVKLSAGLNEIKIEAADLAGHVTNEIRTITYDTVAPNLAITSPAQDVAVNSPGLIIKGTVIDNTNAILSITASVNDVDKPVTLADGKFSLFADFTAEGTYSVAVTVSDEAGNVTTVRRTIVYDVTPPVLTLDPVSEAYPAAFTGTVEAGATLVVKDAAGISGKITFAGQQWTANLSGLNYDVSTLAAQATDAAGNVSVVRVNAPVPDGDMNGDGQVTIEDANIIIKLVASKDKPTAQQLLHGDVGPLRQGKINPNGKLDMVDAILIQKKALGKLTW